MIKLDVLDFNRLSLGGVPWSEWCPFDLDQIESVTPGRACRGYAYVSIVRTKSGAAHWIGQSVDEITQLLEQRLSDAGVECEVDDAS